MKDWNVVITVNDSESFRKARRDFQRFGDVAPTDYHNVLVLRVPDVSKFVALQLDHRDRQKFAQSRFQGRTSRVRLRFPDGRGVQDQGPSRCIGLGGAPVRVLFSRSHAPARLKERTSFTERRAVFG